MPDVTVKTIDELDSWKGGGQFRYAGKGLGVTGWGMNVAVLPPGWADYPEHDHADDGQEEVYLVLDGSATLHASGETWNLSRGSMARVGPAETRRIVPGEDGVTILALGGTPDPTYEPRG